MKGSALFRSFWHRERVLCISLFFALLSMLAVPPNAAYASYIDWRVLGLLFCLMAVVLGLQDCGLSAWLAQRFLTGQKQIGLVVLTLTMLPFFCSMLITNDVALITFVPFTILVMLLIARARLIPWVIVLQTLAANLGSMATPIGNPQNLFLYTAYSLSAGAFFALMLPVTLLSLLTLCIAALATKRETITVRFCAPAQLQNKLFLLICLLLFPVCLLAVFRVIPVWIALGAVLCAFGLRAPRLLRQIDYGLLLTFLCFFVFAGNLGQMPQISAWLSKLLNQNALFAGVLASQIISNVPAAVLLQPFTAQWQALLLGVNIGGLGTPVASLASLISLRYYLRCEGAKPLRYLAIFTAANLAGLAILLPFCMIMLA